MRVFSPEKIVREGVNKIEADKGAKSAHLAVAGYSARRGVGTFFSTAPYFAALSASEVVKDVYRSGEVTKVFSGQDMYAYHHPVDYLSGVLHNDPVAMGLALAPVALFGLYEAAALTRVGLAIGSARRSRANNAVAR